MNNFKKYLEKINIEKLKGLKNLKSPNFKSFDFKKINLKNINFPSGTSKLSTKKQTFFAKRLSFLIKSGVAMVESITLIRDQTKSKSEILIFNKIIADVKNGKSLAMSLERCRGTFGNFAINIIKAGESSGTLTQNLNYLAEELKKKEMLRKKIMSALLYPIIITIATFGITGFLVMYIFPKITPIFSSMKITLPVTTRFLIWVTNAVRDYGVFIFLGIFILVTAIVLIIKKVKKAHFFYDSLILRLPLTGPIAKNYNLTNICRTLGLLLKSGISVTEALVITSNTTENLPYKRSLYEISRGVAKGKTISELISLYPNIFPAMLGHMISIGERSGNLSDTLIYLSEFYENEFDDQTKNLSSSIEPVLMIVMGVTVGFVAISVITPIYEITTNINR